MLDETNALPETNIANENGCLENKLVLISINFTPKTSHSCLTKIVHYVFQVVGIRSFPFGMAFFHGRTVSFRGGNDHRICM